MIVAAKCFNRKCNHYWGILQDNESEENERHHCAAFSDGIPKEIAYGGNKHLKPIEGQDNDIVFERRAP